MKPSIALLIWYLVHTVSCKPGIKIPDNIQDQLDDWRGWVDIFDSDHGLWPAKRRPTIEEQIQKIIDDWFNKEPAENNDNNDEFDDDDDEDDLIHQGFKSDLDRDGLSEKKKLIFQEIRKIVEDWLKNNNERKKRDLKIPDNIQNQLDDWQGWVDIFDFDHGAWPAKRRPTIEEQIQKIIDDWFNKEPAENNNNNDVNDDDDDEDDLIHHGFKSDLDRDGLLEKRKINPSQSQLSKRSDEDFSDELQKIIDESKKKEIQNVIKEWLNSEWALDNESMPSKNSIRPELPGFIKDLLNRWKNQGHRLAAVKRMSDEDTEDYDIYDDEPETTSDPGPITTSTPTIEPEPTTDTPITITPEPITPTPVCKPGQSLQSARDIRVIAQFIFKRENVSGYLEKFFEKATAMQEEMSKEVEGYLQRFSEKPEHLSHIVEELAEKRGMIEKDAQSIANSLIELENLKPVLENYENEFAKLKINYKKNQALCNDFCPESQSYRYNLPLAWVPHNSVLYQADNKEDDRKICAYIDDIYTQITKAVAEWKNDMETKLPNDLEDKKQGLLESFEGLKIKFKTLAVRYFGLTMFDVLSLQDDLKHYDEELQKFKSGKSLYEINKLSTLMKQHLIDLDMSIKLYGQHCKNCMNTGPTWLHRSGHIFVPYSANYEAHDDLVAEITTNVLGEVMSEYNERYQNLFVELEEILNREYNEDSYSEEHIQIQASIKKLVEDEILAFDSVKRDIVSVETLDSVVQLSKDTQQMEDDIINLKSEIDGKLP